MLSWWRHGHWKVGLCGLHKRPLDGAKGYMTEMLMSKPEGVRKEVVSSTWITHTRGCPGAEGVLEKATPRYHRTRPKGQQCLWQRKNITQETLACAPPFPLLPISGHLCAPQTGTDSREGREGTGKVDLIILKFDRNHQLSEFNQKYLEWVAYRKIARKLRIRNESELPFYTPKWWLWNCRPSTAVSSHESREPWPRPGADSPLGRRNKTSHCFDFPVAARTNYEHIWVNFPEKIVTITTTITTQIENCVLGIYQCHFI